MESASVLERFLRFIYVSLIKNYVVNVIKGPLDRNVTKSCVVPYTAPIHRQSFGCNRFSDDPVLLL